MRKSLLALLALVFLAVPLSVLAQSSEAVMPDYSGWEKLDEGTLNVIHDGKPAELFVEQYGMYDKATPVAFFVDLLYSENNELWLAVRRDSNVVVNPDGSATEGELVSYIYEYENGSWKFVKKFQNLDDFRNNVGQFLEDNYKLKIVQ